MSPPCGTAWLRFVGDRLAFALPHPEPGQEGWHAFLRTNLTRGAHQRAETLALLGATARPRGGTSWRDIPLLPTTGGWALDLALTEPGQFQAKAYCVDPNGVQHWPEGADIAVLVHPDRLRTANTIYCAFPRMFGGATARQRKELATAVAELDAAGYAVIPPSGKLRDVTAAATHIFGDLGCRILHLLPVGPVPTTLARMGRFGSPYAQLDLTAIDPALVDFDRRTTGVEQFQELTAAAHAHGGQVFLDILVNHTGWGSRLLEHRPDWFKRNADGSLHSPGAWGTTWEDLVELDQGSPALWDTVARSLLVWCERGVDGFRCDAGYMVPLPAWQYITARVHQVFPETVFLLEGLGGAWEATETLLLKGGMHWAYSELFQNHEPRDVAPYLDHCLRQGERAGLLVHYSETHDNLRLAAQGADWSRLRNRLCALTSQSGGFGFTCGVEWLATEKVDVHEARNLRWGATPNLIPELARLNHLLAEHPCFFDGAEVRRLSAAEAPVLALGRASSEGRDRVLVLVNLDATAPQPCELSAEAWEGLGDEPVDLLGGPAPRLEALEHGARRVTLPAGGSCCLAVDGAPQGLAGDAYRTARAQAAWALQALAAAHPQECLGPAPWWELAALAAGKPDAFLAALPHLNPEDLRADLLGALRRGLAQDAFPRVARWEVADASRVSLVVPGHWLLVADPAPFRLHLRRPTGPDLHLRATPMAQGFAVAVPPQDLPVGDLRLGLQREGGAARAGVLRVLPATPSVPAPTREGLALLTNGRGGMARLQADLGSIQSKYDCLLGANLHASAPSDRHVFVKRLRAWVNANAFISPLDGAALRTFQGGSVARWDFHAPAGDGREVAVHLEATMPEGRNAVLLRWSRPEGDAGEVRLTVRLDLEDRTFHSETTLDAGLEAHFQSSTTARDTGFTFAPAPDRVLRAWTNAGHFRAQPEACRGVPHPIEGGRGLKDHGDAWSPGWFDLPLPPGATVTLFVDADGEALADLFPPAAATPNAIPTCLDQALDAYLARRDPGLTVIAGYPWFLDWGRDTLIACRGLLASGRAEVAGRILCTFAALEAEGSLPNMLGAESTADRDTSDAPLWLALACEEAVDHLGVAFLEADAGGRPVREVLRSLGEHLRSGARHGVVMDPTSALLWSPAHFTWMDTRYPMGTPREGYPVEIQALWVRLLRFLDRMHAPSAGEPWATTAVRAEASLEAFWLPERGWFADALLAGAGVPASEALPADHLRPNQLFLVTLGLVEGAQARSLVAACARHLLVPGGLRSLAPLPVDTPLPIPAPWGGTINDPLNPYWGHYEGDEDTRRKPAYHNGTAWVWPMPSLCEALALAWEGEATALATAQAWLGTLAPLLAEGCVGHLPEILDGDAPHQARGCDAQAWSVSEALRVWKRLNP